MIVYTKNLKLRFLNDTLLYLEEALRFDMEAFYRMDKSIIEQCISAGKKKSALTNLLKLLHQ